MEIVLGILRLLLTAGAAYLVGRLVAKLHLPAILGWLITGMALGPHAFGVLDNSVLEAAWFTTAESLLESVVGLMIGTELIWSQMKRSGKQIVVTTITESLGTFIIVTLVFGVIFYFTGTPLYLAAMFGGIALATAPAPSLSIVREAKAAGPVTSTLIPMAALDDLVGAVVFFAVIAWVSSALASGDVSFLATLAVVFAPVLIGAVTGAIAGFIMRHTRSNAATTSAMLAVLLATSLLAMYLNEYVITSASLNFILLGMAFSTAFANMIPEEKLNGVMRVMNPVISCGLIVLIINLGAPLDYHLVFGAGIYTAVYIISRAAGKYAGAYIGAAATHAPATVKKYLGFTLLPHSGVSLVFTGISVSVLAGPAPECAEIIQGTIAAAAVINEIIAVFMARKGFEWAGELGKAGQTDKTNSGELSA